MVTLTSTVVFRTSIVDAFEKPSFAPFLVCTLSSGSVSFARDHSESVYHDKCYRIRS